MRGVSPAGAKIGLDIFPISCLATFLKDRLLYLTYPRLASDRRAFVLVVVLAVVVAFRRFTE